MDKSEATELLKHVQENQAKLNSCARHQFGPVIGGRALGQTFLQNKRTCENCGGEMADPNIIIYAKGYKAAGGNPDDIGLFCDGQSLA
ncbi:TPA: hypothetical protein NUW79_003105 [Escherichia coli]|nr:hypothetical protein [Escherichia coli]